MIWKALKTAAVAEAHSPLLWGAGVLVYAFLARRHLGYWPSPNHPDPKLLPFEDFHSILFLIGYAAIASPLLVGLYWASPKTWSRIRFSFFGGWALLLVMMFIPGIQFVTWFLD